MLFDNRKPQSIDGTAAKYPRFAKGTPSRDPQ